MTTQRENVWLVALLSAAGGVVGFGLSMFGSISALQHDVQNLTVTVIEERRVRGEWEHEEHELNIRVQKELDELVKYILSKRDIP